MTSPTQLTLRECRRCLWPAAVVEKWNAWARIRQDLFGAIDIVALDDRPGVLGIQATTTSNALARVKKIDGLLVPGSPLHQWIGHGNRLEVWGWGKEGRFWRVQRRVVIGLPPA